jgi:hypothetical protein
LADLANTLGSSNAQNLNLVYDENADTLQLHSNGVGIGDKVSIRNMIDDGIPVVDLNSDIEDDSSSGSNKDENNGCDCGCQNNDYDVVDF